MNSEVREVKYKYLRTRSRSTNDLSVVSLVDNQGTVPLVDNLGAVPVISLVDNQGAVPVASGVDNQGAVPVASLVDNQGEVPVASLVDNQRAVPVASLIDNEGAVPVAPLVDNQGPVPVVWRVDNQGAVSLVNNQGAVPMVSLVNYQGAAGTSANSRMQIDPMSSQGSYRSPILIDLEAISIDLEAINDDVIISSPRTFAEATNNSRRSHRRPVVVDVDSKDWITPSTITRHERSSSNQTFVNCDLRLNLDGSSCSKKNTVNSFAPSAPASSHPPAKPPSYNCPICLGSLEEETTTKCGHIFCNKCIKAAINSKKECPACRRKTNMKDLVRVYLPATS